MRTEAWLVSYGLLGLTQNGLLPVLMPLVAPHGGAAGLTYAAFSFLGLFAPVLGSWADRRGRHRDLLIWGSLGSGVLLLLFDEVSAPLRIMIAAGAGLGVMATTTAGNVLAIQGFPEGEWDARVALLQRFVSTGQVIGLIAAGLLAQAIRVTVSYLPVVRCWPRAFWHCFPLPAACDASRMISLRLGR